ncbi:hypothetical protein BO71DRAFT_443470 [Aspergillus ellipticus CBS 707.79]|uniref:Uncharacterized protein n=1 Tax=Aspergillus ellipticus CBS 707.79 TaxID=1448320 RepID=A0A319D0C1_9EURO|nr:hypothetical protein BO71DRAFT_443470 [Aspergillus ellipticus CBS 707.79]
MHDQDAENLLLVHRPSLRDMASKAEDLSNEIKQIKRCEDFQARLQMKQEELLNLPRVEKVSFEYSKKDLSELEAFLDNIDRCRNTKSYEMGSAAAGSGLRARKVPFIPHATLPSNMDWALIRVSERHQGTNQTESGRYISNPSPKTFNDIEDTPLYLYSRRMCGESKGKYHLLDTATVEIAENVVNGERISVKTLEHTIVGADREPFSQYGDSGALVHTLGGNVVGMLWGCFDHAGISFFTRFDDLTSGRYYGKDWGEGGANDGLIILLLLSVDGFEH